MKWIYYFAVFHFFIIDKCVKSLPPSIAQTLSLNNARARLLQWKTASAINLPISNSSSARTGDSSCLNLVIENNSDYLIQNGYCQISNYLTPLFGSKTRASRVCKAGRVLVNDKKSYGTTIVYPFDNVTIFFPSQASEENEDSLKIKEEIELKRTSRLLNFTHYLFNTKIHNPPVSILYEDNDLAVMFKPAGVHSLAWVGTTKKNIFSFSDCLPLLLNPPTIAESFSSSSSSSSHVNNVPDIFHQMSQDTLEQPLPCHRLDSRVSGCLVIAKTKSAMSNLCNQFKTRQVKKEYHAVLAGFPHSIFTKEDTELGVSKTLAFPIGGRPSMSVIRVLSVVPCNVYGHMTLVSLSPLTGRRHQLRIHCALFGTPIIGDDLYHEVANSGATMKARESKLKEIENMLKDSNKKLRIIASLEDETDIDTDAIHHITHSVSHSEGSSSGSSNNQIDDTTTYDEVDDDEEEEEDMEPFTHGDALHITNNVHEQIINTINTADLSDSETMMTPPPLRSLPPVRRGVGLFLTAVGVEFSHPRQQLTIATAEAAVVVTTLPETIRIHLYNNTASTHYVGINMSTPLSEESSIDISIINTSAGAGIGKDTASATHVDEQIIHKTADINIDIVTSDADANFPIETCLTSSRFKKLMIKARKGYEWQRRQQQLSDICSKS